MHFFKKLSIEVERKAEHEPIEEKVVTKEPLLKAAQVSSVTVAASKNEGEPAWPDFNPRKSSAASYSSSLGLSRSFTIMHEWTKEKLDLESVNEQRKDFIRSIRPLHHKNISGWTSKGYYASNIEGCPAGMEPILDPQVVSISKTGTEFFAVYGHPHKNLGENTYSISSEGGDILFYVLETLGEYDGFPNRVMNIDFSITGPKGGVALEIVGTNKHAIVRNDEEGELGKLIRYGIGPYFSPAGAWSYKLYSRDGGEIARIDHEKDTNKGMQHFYYLEPNAPSINKAIKTQVLAKIDVSDDEKCKLEFLDESTHLDAKKKTLILASLVLIYFKHIRIQPDFGPNKSRFEYGVLYGAVVLFICLVLIIIPIYFVLTAPAQVINNDKSKYCPEIDPAIQ